jgi:hypothetical protein
VYNENNFDALEIILAGLKKFSESDLEERQILVSILSKGTFLTKYIITKNKNHAFGL